MNKIWRVDHGYLTCVLKGQILVSQKPQENPWMCSSFFVQVIVQVVLSLCGEFGVNWSKKMVEEKLWNLECERE